MLSPIVAPSFCASSLPITMPGSPPSVGSSASRLPFSSDRPTLVTEFSSLGSIPLSVMNSFAPALFASPCASTTGAAPTTRGTWRIRLTSSDAGPRPPVLNTYTCAADPTMRSRSSPWRPVMSASTTRSAVTPTATPMPEMSEITEMKACFRRARRYRTAMNSSNGSPLIADGRQLTANDRTDGRIAGASAGTESRRESTGCWSAASRGDRCRRLPRRSAAGRTRAPARNPRP